MANAQRIRFGILIAIVVAATLLRTWNLNQTMIFFGDAAHDMTVAYQSWQTHQLPLLGIASSVPRFHQGPVTIWMEMIIAAVFGHQAVAYGYWFAFISVLAVIGVYEIATLDGEWRMGLAAAFLLAFFPLAIANGRTPYHTTTIPLALVIYLGALLALWHRKRGSMFWATLAFCFLFQFELATLPFVLFIPYVLWRRNGWPMWYLWRKYHVWMPRRSWMTQVGQGVGAIFLGLAPQFLYDATHQFAQLGGFAVWVAYRLASFGGYKQAHLLGIQTLPTVLSSFQQYFTKMWSAENTGLFWAMFIVLVFSFVLCVKEIRQGHKLPKIFELAVIGFCVQTAAYFIHGSPSEAYFPPYFVLTALIMGWLFSWFWRRVSQKKWLFAQAMCLGVCAAYAFFIIQTVVQHNFFVSSQYTFSYGAGLGEQRQIVSLFVSGLHKNPALYTQQPDGKFPNYFDNLRWLMADKGIVEDTVSGQPIFIEPRNTDFPKFITYEHVSFPSTEVYILGKSF